MSLSPESEPRLESQQNEALEFKKQRINEINEQLAHSHGTDAVVLEAEAVKLESEIKGAEKLPDIFEPVAMPEMEILKQENKEVASAEPTTESPLEIAAQENIKPPEIVMETDSDFLNKQLAEQKIDLRPATAEHSKLDSQQAVEQSNSEQFETPDQLKQEAEQNAQQAGQVVGVEKSINAPAVQELGAKGVSDPAIEKVSPEAKETVKAIFNNPETAKRMQEIKAELGEEREVIQALEEELVDRKNKVKLLEAEMDKLEQTSLVTFFRNAPKFEAANKRGATAVARGMAISELHFALEKYDRIKDQSFLAKMMKKLSAKMKKLFKQAYPDLFPQKAKLEKAKKLAKVKKAKPAVIGKGLVGKEGLSVA